jgi:hypothetical protein
LWFFFALFDLIFFLAISGGRVFRDIFLCVLFFIILTAEGPPEECVRWMVGGCFSQCVIVFWTGPCKPSFLHLSGCLFPTSRLCTWFTDHMTTFTDGGSMESLMMYSFLHSWLICVALDVPDCGLWLCTVPRFFFSLTSLNSLQLVNDLLGGVI